MKKTTLFFTMLLSVSCSGLFPSIADSELTVTIDSLDPAAKSDYFGTDADDYILSVRDSRGGDVYHGRFADSPERMSLPSGVYTVSAVSSESREPAYSRPLFGDEQVVKLASGETAHASLLCTQSNSGVRLDVSPEFRSQFPSAAIYLVGPGGRLMYSYGERRTAYFLPGTFCVTMADGQSGEMQILSRELEPGQILNLRLGFSQSSPSRSGIELRVDTTRVRVSEEYIYQGGTDTPDDDGFYTVPEVPAHIGERDVLVCGYIVGSCPSSSKVETAAPFTRATNIVIAARTSFSDKASSVAVELPSGAVRNALNLLDHPENLGRKVLLRGNIEASYYSMTGLKSVSWYEWE